MWIELAGNFPPKQSVNLSSPKCFTQNSRVWWTFRDSKEGVPQNCGSWELLDDKTSSFTQQLQFLGEESSFQKHRAGYLQDDFFFKCISPFDENSQHFSFEMNFSLVSRFVPQTPQNPFIHWALNIHPVQSLGQILNSFLAAQMHRKGSFNSWILGWCTSGTAGFYTYSPPYTHINTHLKDCFRGGTRVPLCSSVL